MKVFIIVRKIEGFPPVNCLVTFGEGEAMGIVDRIMVGPSEWSDAESVNGPGFNKMTWHRNGDSVALEEWDV